MFWKFRITFTSTTLLEKSVPHHRDVPFTVRNKLRDMVDWIYPDTGGNHPVALCIISRPDTCRAGAAGGFRCIFHSRLKIVIMPSRSWERSGGGGGVCLLVGCLTSQQQASVSQGRICKDNFTCCHTEIEVADQTFYLTQSQYTDTGPTSPCADPIMSGPFQGSHWSAIF